MWFSSYRTSATCHPNERTDFCADRYGDAGHANSHYHADTATNIDAETNPCCDAGTSTTTDDATTRLNAAYP